TLWAVTRWVATRRATIPGPARSKARGTRSRRRAITATPGRRGIRTAATRRSAAATTGEVVLVVEAAETEMVVGRDRGAVSRAEMAAGDAIDSDAIHSDAIHRHRGRCSAQPTD